MMTRFELQNLDTLGPGLGSGYPAGEVEDFPGPEGEDGGDEAEERECLSGCSCPV